MGKDLKLHCYLVNGKTPKKQNQKNPPKIRNELLIQTQGIKYMQAFSYYVVIKSFNYMKNTHKTGHQRVNRASPQFWKSILYNIINTHVKDIYQMLILVIPGL